MHRAWVLAAASATIFCAPAAAQADPRITDVSVSGTPLAGEPLVVTVRATDPQAPVTSVGLRFPSSGGGFGESACSLKRNGRPDLQHGYSTGKDTRFSVPWVPTAVGSWDVDVKVTSGACGVTPKQANRRVRLAVGLADLPVFPVKGSGKKAKTSAVDLKPCANAYLVPNGRNNRKIRGALACLINVTRQAKGLGILKPSGRLRVAAMRHNRDMLARRYFDHQGPGGPTLAQRLQTAGYWPASAGENLALGTGVLATPYAVFLAWMDSDGHRENMLHRDLTEIGTSVAPGTPDDPADGATYTTEFGRRY